MNPVMQVQIALFENGQLQVQCVGTPNLLLILGMIEKAKTDLLNSAREQAAGPQIAVAPPGMAVARNGR